MKTFTVIAVNGFGNTITISPLTKDSQPRGYREPIISVVHVDEEKRRVFYNGQEYLFVDYRGAVHAMATAVAIMVAGRVVEIITDKPFYPDITTEQIMDAFEKRRNDPASGY